VRTNARESVTVGDGAPAFTVRVPSMAAWNRIWRLDAYRAALAFLRGEFDITGDLVAAVKAWSSQARPARITSALFSLAARIRPERWWQTRAAARHNIAFHYDRFERVLPAVSSIAAWCIRAPTSTSRT
jgi:hypothetical protein